MSEYLDILGRRIEIGNIVATTDRVNSLSHLKLFKVNGYRQSQIVVSPLFEQNNSWRDPEDCIIVDEQAVIFYILKKEV